MHLFDTIDAITLKVGGSTPTAEVRDSGDVIPLHNHYRLWGERSTRR